VRSSPDERWAIALTLGVGLLLASVSPGWAYDPKADGKDFAKTVLIPKGDEISTDDTKPAEVPQFTDAPPGTEYEDDAPKMEADAAAARASNEAYNAMVDSMATRATFSKSELEETTELGREVIADPGAYSGTAITGTQGSCTEIVAPPSSPGFYEQTCNTGYTELPTVETKTCDISITVNTTTEQDIFSSGITEPIFRGDPRCRIILGPIPRGRDFTYKGRNYFSTSGPAHVWRCTGTSYVDLTPHPVYSTDTVPQLPPVEDASACSAYASNPDCTLDFEVCTDSTPETRTVAGVPVTLPCWGKQRQYSCNSAGVPRIESDCPDLAALGCVFDRTECLTEDVPCMTLEEIWRCPLPPAPGPTDTFICEGDIYCIDGSCDTIEREANTEFKDALAGLNALAQAGREFNEADLTLFKGTPLACTKLIFGVKNCCVPRGLPLVGGCDGEDRILKEQREEGLCTYVGSWCSDKFVVCLAKKERHCCYASKLSRIIQEQGRKQLGIPWEDPKDETCRGFTIEEFASLDLSVMDFAEVYAEFEAAASLPAELEVLDDMKAKIEAYYDVHG